MTYPRDLPARLRAAIDWLRQPGSGAFVGLGPMADLETVMQLLGEREWLEFLRVNGDEEQAGHARTLLASLDTLESADDAAAHVRNLPGEPHALDPVSTIERLDDAVDEARADYISVRNVLVQVGALSRDDTQTPVADLVRALLS